MADDNAENKKDPTPLSQEGATIQLKLSTDPPPPDEKSTLKFRPKTYINDLISVQKEKGGDDTPEPQTSSSGSGAKTPPPADTKSIITRLGDEGDGGSSGGSSAPPNPEQSKDGAGMLIDGFNALFLFAVGIWSKDPDAKEYQVDNEEKRRLKTYLTSIMHNSGKAIPPLWLFIGLFILTYIPMLWKGWQHRKLVEEQRLKNNPSTKYINIEPKRKRRRRSGGGDDAEFYHAEEVR